MYHFITRGGMGLATVCACATRPPSHEHTSMPERWKRPDQNSELAGEPRCEVNRTVLSRRDALLNRCRRADAAGDPRRPRRGSPGGKRVRRVRPRARPRQRPGFGPRAGVATGPAGGRTDEAIARRREGWTTDGTPRVGTMSSDGAVGRVDAPRGGPSSRPTR